MLSRAKEWVIFLLASTRVEFVRKLAIKISWAIIKGFGNFSFNMRLNGEFRVVERLLPRTDGVLFDVGANHGEWAERAAKIKPNHQIYCFEVIPDTARILRNRVASIPEIAVFDVGLSDKNGSTKVYFAKGHDAHSSLISPMAPGNYEIIDATLMTGDTFALTHGVKHIGFLKIDVEGAEHQVLNGFRQLLSENAIDAIQFEYGKFNISTRFFLRDFYKLLNEYGFIVGKIFPNRVDFQEFRDDLEDFIGPNYLAVRRNLPHLIDAVR